MAKDICIYHGTDLDGACSGAVVKKKHKGVLLLPGVYGRDSELEKRVPDGARVFLVDYSLAPFERMEKLAARTHLVWIDHHEAVLRTAKAKKFDPDGIRRIGEAGCQLTWKHLFKDMNMPLAVDLLGKWDVDIHDDKRIDPFQFGMRSLPNGPESQIWEALLRPGFTDAVKGIIEEGKTVMRYDEEMNRRAMASAFEIKWKGHRVLAVNKGGANSGVFKSRYDPDRHDIMMSFAWNGKNWDTRLYSDKVGVSVIAEKLGGGGHKGAAGFISDKPPVKLGGRDE